ncbi:MAG: transposase [Anaerolineae bacterium]
MGRSHAGFSSKIHVTVDAVGNPLRVRLTAGQRHDSPQAQSLLEGYACNNVIADCGYAAESLHDWTIQ